MYLSEVVAVKIALDEMLETIFSQYHAIVPEDATLGDYYNYEVLPYNVKQPTIRLYEGSWIVGDIVISELENLKVENLSDQVVDMLNQYVDEEW